MALVNGDGGRLVAQPAADQAWPFKGVILDVHDEATTRLNKFASLCSHLMTGFGGLKGMVLAGTAKLVPTVVGDM